MYGQKQSSRTFVLLDTVRRNREIAAPDVHCFSWRSIISGRCHREKLVHQLGKPTGGLALGTDVALLRPGAINSSDMQ